MAKKDIRTWLSWVNDARFGSRVWRLDSWRDSELYDGEILTRADIKKAVQAGIDPVMINRIFPTVNMILGSESINRFDVVAKARTTKDSEISQTMTEAIRFVMDQNDGRYLVSEAFKNQVIPGFGALAVVPNHDPRFEKIRLEHWDWKETFWDPFASPWLDPLRCRYVFRQKWCDLEDLITAFPSKKKELREVFDEYTGYTSTGDYNMWADDEANLVEEQKRTLIGSDWADSKRRRVRPVEMFFPKLETGMFATFADGRVIEATEAMDPRDLFQLFNAAQEVVQATVKRMYACTFLGQLTLQEPARTPFNHDYYPVVPFVGYLDRFNSPFGVPRQVRGQSEEVTRRRSMALALLKSKRVRASDKCGDPEKLQQLYQEANKLDGFMVVPDEHFDKFIIEDDIQLADAHVRFLEHAEKEIGEISGANDPSMGYRSNVKSGVALEKEKQSSAVVLSSVFDNLRRSTRILGTLCRSAIQSSWTGEKILRITDRLTGAEKFVELNKRIADESGIRIENNVTQGRFDIVVSEAPATDTVREQNLNLIIEWVKKSPPQIIPHLMHLAFEMSNLPNKEQLLARIKPVLGVNPAEEEMTTEERKQMVVQELEAQKQAQAQAAEIEGQKVQLELQKMDLENQKVQAEIFKILGEQDLKKFEAWLKKERHDIDAFKDGLAAGAQIQQPQPMEVPN